jgi:hypothetical protein
MLTFCRVLANYPPMTTPACVASSTAVYHHVMKLLGECIFAMELLVPWLQGIVETAEA